MVDAIKAVTEKKPPTKLNTESACLGRRPALHLTLTPILPCCGETGQVATVPCTCSSSSKGDTEPGPWLEDSGVECELRPAQQRPEHWPPANSPYLLKAIVLLAVGTVPTVAVPVGHQCVMVAEPAVDYRVCRLHPVDQQQR